MKDMAIERLTNVKYPTDVDFVIISRLFSHLCLKKLSEKECAIKILTSKLFLRYIPDHQGDWKIIVLWFVWSHI